jgi:YCII-related domain
MKFILISRHTNGAEIPETKRESNLKDMGEWIALLKPVLAMPIRGGSSVTASRVNDYSGDVGGVIVFEADSIDQAVSLAQESPGLKYGFTHEVFPEISMNQAAQHRVCVEQDNHEHLRQSSVG